MSIIAYLTVNIMIGGLDSLPLYPPLICGPAWILYHIMAVLKLPITLDI